MRVGTPHPGNETTLNSVVYGVQPDGFLYFMERDEALWYAYFFYACEIAETYADFQRLAPPGVWDEMLQRFEWTEDGQPLDMAAPFDGGADVPGASEAEWQYPSAMKLWIPQEVQDQFGYHSGSPVSGDYTLMLETLHEAGIVQMMEQHGFRCERDDRLISAAYGIAPNEGWKALAEELNWSSTPLVEQ